MDVAIPFKYHGKLNDKVQQFNIAYDVNENSFDNLIDFVQTYSDRQVNIEYIGAFDAKTAKAISKVSDNVRFRLRAEDVMQASKLREAKAKFFYDSTLAANNWYSLVRQVKVEGVSEVYVSDDLMFDLKRVREWCDAQDTRIRCVLNRVALTRPAMPDMYFTPFFRPQDYPVYEKYFDVAEFDCGKRYNFKELGVLYRQFIEKHDWYGDIQEINQDVPFSVPCRGVVNLLAKKRANCGARCLAGSSCRMCENAITLAQDLKDVGAQLYQE